MRKLAWIVALLAACSKPANKAPADKPDTTDNGTPSVVEKAGSAAPTPEPGEKPHHRKHEDRRDPVVADAPALKLEVRVKGQPATWDQAAFAKVAKYTKGSDGDARDVWSLRELAHQLVSPTAHVTLIAGDEGAKPIDDAAWSDAARTPLLHTTRRGTLKFRWADADGKWGETEVKDVTRLEITP